MEQKIRFQKTNPRAQVPTYGSVCAAGADLYALTEETLVIPPHTTLLVHTGIAMEIPDGFVGLVCARSGLATKRNLAPANKVGVIDSDYRGEIMVALHNHGDGPAEVQDGERIAQLVIVPYLTATFTETESLTETERAAGGFGSTGTK